MEVQNFIQYKITKNLLFLCEKFLQSLQEPRHCEYFSQGTSPQISLVLLYQIIYTSFVNLSRRKKNNE